LRQGRCYAPSENLKAVGLAPADLLDPNNESKFRPLYNQWLDRAEGHLAAGWEYTLALPWRCVRVRLACAWPILIGLRTLHALREGQVLDPNHRLKISRAEVSRIIRQTIFLYPVAPRWRGLFERYRRP
jgi:farnesyl-diphosphate farnesyltransferase